jgi:flagellar biosynthesis/type III secretory pathway protein FliH
MAGTITIRLDKAIQTAKLYDLSCSETEQADLLKHEHARLLQLNRALREAVNRVSEIETKLMREYKDQIAKLSVAIAGRIVAKKVEQGDYAIEAILRQAMESSPSRQDVVAHLNPVDLATYEALMEANPSERLGGVTFVADSAVGRAECVLETPKGVIESLIERHLEHMGEALKEAV